MNSIRMLPIADHDKTVKLHGVEIPCYKKKELDAMYPNDNWIIVGETKAKNKKKVLSELYLSDVIAIDQLEVDENGNEIPLKVSKPGSYNKLLYKRAGYVPVDAGADTYVALLKFRAAFIFWLLALLALIGLCVGLIFWMIGQGDDVPTYNPIPPVDQAETPIPDDDSTEFRLAEDGAYMSMNYRLKATLSLSTGEIEIFYQNPRKSNQNAALELYIVSGETEVKIAESGVIQPGYQLRQMQFDRSSASLSEGLYAGKFMVSYYSPSTGERAVVESELVNVEITVTQ